MLLYKYMDVPFSIFHERINVQKENLKPVSS